MHPAAYDWDDLKYLLACWRTGSLSAAARVLKVDQTTVGRRLGALEDALAARLFDRMPTGFTLTETGERLIELAQRIEQGAIDLSRVATGGDVRLDGTVRLATTETLATTFVMRQLASLHRAHPDIELEVVTGMASANLLKREADLALRAGPRPTQQTLVVRRLAQVGYAVYAGARYAPRAAGKVGATLDGHEVIAFCEDLSAAPAAKWLDQHLGGGRVVLRCNSFLVAAEAAHGGWGLVVLPTFLGDGEGLTRVAEVATATDLWLVVHADLQHTPRVRAVIDHLTAVVAGAGLAT